MTEAELNRLRELERLEAEGVTLTAAENLELVHLLVMEKAELDHDNGREA